MPDTTAETDPRLLVLRDEDNVCIACTVLDAATSLFIEGTQVTLVERVLVGHKIARWPIKQAEKILKYGAPIGSATQDIKTGEPVHTHNLKSDYIASYTLDEARTTALQGDAK